MTSTSAGAHIDTSNPTASGRGAEPPKARRTRIDVLAGVSVAHMLNDTMQSVILALYPLLKGEFDLGFFQIGAISLTFQITASLLQPVVGTITDRRPMPFLMPIGMCFTLSGLLLLSVAPTYALLLVAVALIGCGSATFHPEASRVARMASGGHFGMAQSVFQLGGNVGQALGPTLAAAVVLTVHHQGRPQVAWFGLIALLAIVVLLQIGRWSSAHNKLSAKTARAPVAVQLPARTVRRAVGILLALMFSKFFYLVSISSYYTFYLMHQFGVSVHTAANLLAVFLGAIALGTLLGGPLGDRIGRRRVIWLSILGCAPFTLLLPHVGLELTVVLSVVIGLLLASAFPAIIVYGQDMLTHRIGMVSGLFYGFSFGLGGIGAAALGLLADRYGIVFVYQVCAFLPLLGLLAIWLPDVRPPPEQAPLADA